MLINVLLLSDCKKDLEKVDFILEKISSYNLLFKTFLFKNYEEDINSNSFNVQTFLNFSKRQMIDEFLNIADYSALMLDLSYSKETLTEAIDVSFRNSNKDIIYFNEKCNKFTNFFNKLDNKLFSLYLFQKNKEKHIKNINSIQYINFNVLKLMRMTDEKYAYLQNFDVFNGFDVLNYQLSSKNQKMQFKPYIFPIIFCFILAFSIVLCLNLIKYFKTTNNIINLVIASFFIFVLLVFYSYLAFYSIKFKKILK